MSRYYEMDIKVRGYDKAKLSAIDDAVAKHWSVDDDFDNGEDEYVFTGRSNLTGGEGEEDFTRRVTHAIWEANGAYCEVEVRAAFLEAVPTNYHSLDEDDYEKWNEVRQCPTKTA